MPIAERNDLTLGRAADMDFAGVVPLILPINSPRILLCTRLETEEQASPLWSPSLQYRRLPFPKRLGSVNAFGLRKLIRGSGSSCP